MKTAIKSGSTIIEIEPIEVTLRTSERLTVWKNKLIEQAKSKTVQSFEVTLKLLEAFPDLAEIMNVSREIREDYIDARAKQFDKAPNARELAIEEAKRKIIQIATDSPKVARELFSPDIIYSTDKESHKLGIECIRDTFNPDGLDKKEIKLLQGDIESDFWQNSTAAGVAVYCQNFCEQIK
jgi:hypothetical protein